MPKFIGRTIADSKQLEDAPSGSVIVGLSYSQASLLSATEIYWTLNTSDRGSRSSLAKRWHNWYATAATIEGNARSTAKMRQAARLARTRPISSLISNFSRLGQHLVAEHEVSMRPLRTLARCLVDAAACEVLASRGFLASLIDAERQRSADRIPTREVAGDLLEQAGLDRNSVNVIGPFVASNCTHGGWRSDTAWARS